MFLVFLIVLEEICLFCFATVAKTVNLESQFREMPPDSQANYYLHKIFQALEP
jgi:hypothetical protein